MLQSKGFIGTEFSGDHIQLNEKFRIIAGTFILKTKN